MKYAFVDALLFFLGSYATISDLVFFVMLFIYERNTITTSLIRVSHLILDP